jgi:hypothetical protein
MAQRTALTLSIAAVLYIWLAPVFWTPSVQAIVAPSPKNEEGWSFREHLQNAQVSYGEHRCTTWTGNRWDCGLEAWLWVGRFFGTLTHNGETSSRRCIWAHPRTHNGVAQPVEIRFPSVVLGNAIRGEVAILDVPHHGPPAELSIFIGPSLRRKVIARDRSSARGDGWKPWSFKTHREKGQVVNIRFEVGARNAAWRQVCFTAFVDGIPVQ